MRKLIHLALTAFVVCGMFAGKVLAATGEIVFVNPNEKIAKVERRDDGSFHDYVIVSPFDLLDPNTYDPQVGDCVNFNPDRGRRAFDVEFTRTSTGPTDECGPKSR